MMSSVCAYGASFQLTIHSAVNGCHSKLRLEYGHIILVSYTTALVHLPFVRLGHPTEIMTSTDQTKHLGCFQAKLSSRQQPEGYIIATHLNLIGL